MTTYAPSRLYRTVVTAVTVLSPHFVRVTVADESLQWFGGHRFDQRIKLLLPGSSGLPPLSFFDRGVGEWYPEWRALSDEVRGFMRTYTVRATRPAVGELDIDFVLHGVHGPASAWATAAVAGSELFLIGPDARAEAAVSDVGYNPGEARHLLLVGDETAAPAITSIAASLDPDVSCEAFIEVPCASDVLDFQAPHNVAVTWFGRENLPNGEWLREAVQGWGARRSHRLAGVSPAAQPGTLAPSEYVWIAGEAGTVTGLRRYLVREVGVDRTSISFMGYWKLGAAEQN